MAKTPSDAKPQAWLNDTQKKEFELGDIISNTFFKIFSSISRWEPTENNLWLCI